MDQQGDGVARAPARRDVVVQHQAVAVGQPDEVLAVRVGAVRHGAGFYPPVALLHQPDRRLDGADTDAPKIGDEAILRRAKDLCAQNGAIWDASELEGAERWERNKIVVDDEGRRKYLALAREELFNECADA